MPPMTYVSAAHVKGPLPDVGIRVGADTGDPWVGLLGVGSVSPGSVGIWECQPGGWSIDNRPDTEVAFFLAGQARITDGETGKSYTVSAGDLVVLPRGWSGRWDVIAPVRKVFVIF